MWKIFMALLKLAGVLLMIPLAMVVGAARALSNDGGSAPVAGPRFRI